MSLCTYLVLLPSGIIQNYYGLDDSVDIVWNFSFVFARYVHFNNWKLFKWAISLAKVCLNSQMVMSGE